MTETISPELLKQELDQFSGTEQYWKWSALFKHHVLTDGARYLARTAEAYWLMDAIASWHYRTSREDFQVWRLKKNKTGSGAMLSCDDGNDNFIVRQQIKWTDFPLDEIKLYCANNGDGRFVIMLPSEY